MGLRTLDLATWLLVDEGREAELARKRELLTARPEDVVAARSGTEAAGGEVLDLVVAWLGRHHRRLDRKVSAEPTLHPLDAAGRLVQEDLCLMMASDQGYRLEAASLCFPSHWRLHDKLGRSLAAIHAPVPHYAEELERKVDTFFDRLRSDRPVQRRNWSIHNHDELFVPGPFESPGSFAPDADGVGQVWLRSERQTLLRLPRTGAVLFTIKTQQCPIVAVTARPDIAASLADVLRAQAIDLSRRGDRVPFPGWLPDWLDEA